MIAYSGDTEWSENLIDAARKTDLFVCEAYFFDKRIKTISTIGHYWISASGSGADDWYPHTPAKICCAVWRDLEIEYAEDARIIEL